MKPHEFVALLTETATHHGVAFERLRLIREAQLKHGRKLSALKGYAAMAGAFQCFVLETVEQFNTDCRPRVASLVPATHALFLQRIAHNFQSLCAAELIAANGYPLQGYTLLRNTFDSVILTSAVLQGLTTFYAIEGIDPAGPFDPKRVVKDRKAVEHAVRRKMTGADSGLTQVTLDALKLWDGLFDAETHGGQLSMARSQGWLRGREPLALTPRYHEMSAAIFVNRFSEIAWMLHRVLPCVQLQGNPLSDAWGDKWRLLDDAFRTIVLSITRQLGKPIGNAIAELTDAKFPFDHKSRFPLTD